MALRKGSPNRKVPKSCADRIVKAARTLGKKTREVNKLERETARSARLKLKQENEQAAQKLRNAEHERLVATDRARGRGFESLGAFSPLTARAVEQPAPKPASETPPRMGNPFPPKGAPDFAHSPPGYFTSIDRSTGDITRIALPPVRAESEPKVAPKAAPANRVEEMRARYLAHHTTDGAIGASGFADPGGVVSFNINAESGGATVRVTGPWAGVWKRR